jgi:hypothetical protein
MSSSSRIREYESDYGKHKKKIQWRVADSRQGHFCGS